MDIPHSMAPGHRPWKKSILTGDALYAAWWPCPPLHVEQQHLPWTESVYFDLDNTPGLNVTNAIPPFIYSVEPVYVVRSKHFLCTFFVVDSFRSPCCLCFSYSPPFLPHVACVLFMYPNHLMLRWVVNESVWIRKKKEEEVTQVTHH